MNLCTKCNPLIGRRLLLIVILLISSPSHSKFSNYIQIFMANNSSFDTTSSAMNANDNQYLSPNPFALKLDIDACLREFERRQINVCSNSIFDRASTSSLLPLANTRVKFVFEKELTRSDVSSVGRIVLPKKEAEAKLPILEDKWGIILTVRDALSSDKWRMKYRFWPNHQSRMFVLENTGEFIKRYNLSFGDFIAIYQDNLKQNFICAKKGRYPPYPLELDAFVDDRTNDHPIATRRNEHLFSTEHASSTVHDNDTNGGPAVMPIENQRDSWNVNFGFDDGFTNFSNQNPTQFERFPWFG